ncbi:MAG: hypothetical protein U0V73_07960 [Acidimicrobiia bacterium]
MLLPIVATASLLVLAGGAFAGDAPTAAGPRSLAVSVPPDPVTFDQDGHATVHLRVSDPGGSDVPVTFQQRALELGDNGTVHTLTDVDPRWGPHVELPKGEFVIPAQGYQEFDVKVTKPPDLAPDVYLVGFVVTPRPAPSGSVQAINQIGSYFTVDVPGPRDWRIEATLALPTFKLGGEVDGKVVVRNVGRSSLRFWGDVTERFFPFGSPKQQRIEKLFLPSGKWRSIPVSAAPRWGIGIVTVPARISYPSGTDGSTSVETVVTKKVFVVHPLYLVALAVIVSAGAFRIVRRRRDRRPPKQRRVKAPKARHAKTPEARGATAPKRQSEPEPVTPETVTPEQPSQPVPVAVSPPSPGPEHEPQPEREPEPWSRPARPEATSAPTIERKPGADGSPNLLPSKNGKRKR